MCMSKIVYSKELLNYDFSPEHPLTSERLRKFIQQSSFKTISARKAKIEELELVYSKKYINAVKKEERNLKYELGSVDVPIFKCMHDASSWCVGASLKSMEYY